MNDSETLNYALRLAHKLAHRMSLLRVSLKYRNSDSLCRDIDRRKIRRNIALVRETQADLYGMLT